MLLPERDPAVRAGVPESDGVVAIGAGDRRQRHACVVGWTGGDAEKGGSQQESADVDAAGTDRPRGCARGAESRKQQDRGIASTGNGDTCGPPSISF